MNPDRILPASAPGTVVVPMNEPSFMSASDS